MSNPKNYEKTYFLDTNIILDDYENLVTLSQNSNNLIVICETVLDELDSKKTLEGSLGYNSREFSRWMEKSTTGDKLSIDNGRIIEIKLTLDDGTNIDLHFVKVGEYSTDESNTDIKNLNDRRILECAKVFQEYYGNLIILSNDIAFRSRCILEDVPCEAFRTDNKKVNELNLYASFAVEDTIEFPVMKTTLQGITSEDISQTCGVELIYKSGLRKYGYLEGEMFYEVDEKELSHQIMKPINMRQKILSNMIISDTNDIVLVSSKAGGGKNGIITSGCCALMDKKGSQYEGITYIRANLDSIDDRDMELGLLPGSADEKMAPYLRPLKDTVETLTRMKYKVALARDRTSLDEKIEEFMGKYNIGYEAINFLRGGTIRNKLVILDEAQNLSVSSMKLILTRIGDNCKVFILGDVQQIDSKYLNERNNGLTFMMNRVGKEDDIRIVGIDLNKTIRSKISGWAADNM